jgi:hypothetical protein
MNDPRPASKKQRWLADRLGVRWPKRFVSISDANDLIKHALGQYPDMPADDEQLEELAALGHDVEGPWTYDQAEAILHPPIPKNPPAPGEPA